MSGSVELPESILIVRDNIVKHMNPLGLPLEDCSRWCKREASSTILYTGSLYSVMEIVYSHEKLLSMVTSTPDKKFLPKAARIFMNFRPLYRKIFAKTDGKIYSIPEKALAILDKLGVNVGCMKREPYVGVLLYELGFHREFREYANRVYKMMKDLGVERVITIDPHTYEILKYIYPKYVENYDLDVINFIDILIENIKNGSIKLNSKLFKENYTFHDPCHYSKSRFRSIVEEPRMIIKLLGIEVKESMKSGVDSMCCGGPIETYFQKLAKKVAEVRYRDLKSTGADKIIVACPICFSSLSSVANSPDEVVDLVELVYEALVK